MIPKADTPKTRLKTLRRYLALCLCPLNPRSWFAKGPLIVVITPSCAITLISRITPHYCNLAECVCAEIMNNRFWGILIVTCRRRLKFVLIHSSLEVIQDYILRTIHGHLIWSTIHKQYPFQVLNAFKAALETGVSVGTTKEGKQAGLRKPDQLRFQRR
jgi:hypothetical protein